jgi:alanine dehydrogenase
VVADISCDIAGPIACTIRPSTILNPVYGFDPVSKQEVDFMRKDAVAVMAVDNLPCELPMDASEDFGNDFISYVLPNFFNGDPDKTIERGSETNLNGELMPLFEYLNDYLSDN